MSKLTRLIISGKDLDEKIEAGVEAVYKVANTCYGPAAGNALIELNYSYPQSSRDGVTNLRKLYLDDATENMAARTIIQASEKNNKIVGDGTTAVAILSRFLYLEAMKLVSGGHNRMVVERLLKQTGDFLIHEIDKMKIKTNSKISRYVAKVSASDEAIGDMIADVIEKVGIEGSIIVEEFDGIGSYDEIVDGFYFRKGFTNEFLINNLTNLESRVNDADILITAKTLKTAADIKPILEKIVGVGGTQTELVIIGEVIDEALATLALNKVKQIIFPTLVDVPVYGAMRTLFLEDIAAYTGGKVLPQNARSDVFTTDMLGEAGKVIVNSFSTTIIDGSGSEEDKEIRIADLREQYKNAESLVDKEEIKKRLSSLTGKVAIVRVGAPTEIDRGDIQLRVEDAIAATQSAIRDGVVPGGGVCLARLAPESFGDAYRALFETLVINAGYNPKEALYKMLNTSTWYGYDLRNYTPEPIDMLKHGIIDPAEVIKETVRNATSVVSKLLTTQIGLVLKDRESKID